MQVHVSTRPHATIELSPAEQYDSTTGTVDLYGRSQTARPFRVRYLRLGTLGNAITITTTGPAIKTDGKIGSVDRSRTYSPQDFHDDDDASKALRDKALATAVALAQLDTATAQAAADLNAEDLT